MKKTRLTLLLNKNMDRREFLIYLGTSFVALIGITSFTNALLPAKKTRKKTSLSYGSMPYGGRKLPIQ